MSAFELYDHEVVAELNPDMERRVPSLRSKHTQLEALGLKRQAQEVKDELTALERSGRITSPPQLTPDELLIWKAWLPQAYAVSTSENILARPLEEYGFDRIPGPVLERWNSLKSEEVFERFEIWTPESGPDPVLVGINGTAHHIVARWGESDANFVSFDDIKRTIYRRACRGVRVRHDGEAAAQGAIVTVVVFAVLLLTGQLTEPFALWKVLALGLLWLGVSGLLLWRMIHRYTRRHPVVQAVLRHDNSQSS